MKKPKLEVRQYKGEGYYSYAVFRADRTLPMCSGMSKAHANHVMKLLKRETELKETIKVLKNWFDHDTIIPDHMIDDDGNLIEEE